MALNMFEDVYSLFESPIVIAATALSATVIFMIAFGRLILYRGEVSAGWWFSDHLSCRCVILYAIT